MTKQCYNPFETIYKDQVMMGINVRIQAFKEHIPCKGNALRAIDDVSYISHTCLSYVLVLFPRSFYCILQSKIILLLMTMNIVVRWSVTYNIAMSWNRPWKSLNRLRSNFVKRRGH